MSSLKIELPYPPSVNFLYVRNKGGGLRVSDQVKTFRYKVLAVCYSSKVQFTGDVFLNVKLYPPDKRVRDIDNPLKNLLDSLQKANVYANDNQVKKLLVEQMEVKKPGSCIVEIIPL